MAGPAPNRAFRFIHPDLDQTGASADEQCGLCLGLRGSLAMVSGDDAVRQAVLLLLSTRPGERVMRPNYGCNLNKLVFAPNDDTTAAVAIHYVQQALLQWEPRIDILNLDAHRDPYQANILVIELKYQIRTTQQTEDLQIPMTLDGGGT